MIIHTTNIFFFLLVNYHLVSGNKGINKSSRNDVRESLNHMYGMTDDFSGSSSAMMTKAIYDPRNGAPSCLTASSVCDSDGLLLGVGDESGGPEPNFPNTIDDCTDVSGAVYQKDESIERIIVRSQDGSILTAGCTATVRAIVLTATDTSKRSMPSGFEVAHFYQASNLSIPVEWTYIGTRYALPHTGSQIFECSYTLSKGELQAVRVNYGYNEFIEGPCTALGGYNDVDDVVFSVSPAPVPSTFAPISAPSMALIEDLFPLMAVYDSQYYAAPRCFFIGSSCDTGSTLVSGSGVNEINAPNTIDGCSVASDGNFFQNSSIEQVKVVSLNGQNMTVGSNVRIIATVGSVTNSSENIGSNQNGFAHFFSSSNVEPKWKYLKTLYITLDPGMTVDVYCDYFLPEGDVHAVRVNYGVNERTIGPCTSTDGLNDIDDLIFAVDLAVTSPSPQPDRCTESPDPYKYKLATYNSSYRSPVCEAFGESCDTGAELIAGAGDKEYHSPNVIDDCIQSFSRVSEQDESIDRISIRSAEDSIMTPGTVVTIEAIVVTASDTNTRTSPDEYDVAHFFHTRNASSSSPEWNYITTIFVSPGMGSQVLSYEFTLPYGELQAIRINYGYEQYTIASCPANATYTDVDDLVFAVDCSRNQTTADLSTSSAPSMSIQPSSSPTFSSVPSISSLPSYTPTKKTDGPTWWDNWWPLPPLPSSSPKYDPIYSELSVVFLSLLLLMHLT